MNAATLARAMACPLERAERYVAAYDAAMLAAGCTTVNRAAMFTAQLGHESAGLRYFRELADGKAYNGRADLGNTQPGDGPRFRGAGPIQVTGRHNFGLVSRWAQSKGYVPTPTYFVDRPEELAGDRFGFLGAVWYWTVARPRLNALSDAGDLVGATKAINGGTNGLADRRERWERCRGIGAALLPAGQPAPAPAAAPAGGGGAAFRAEHGQVGAHVWRLADFLNRTFPGYRDVPIPLDRDQARQRYGDQTARAVKEFADRSGIPADGRNVGPQLADRLARLGFRG